MKKQREHTTIFNKYYYRLYFSTKLILFSICAFDNRDHIANKQTNMENSLVFHIVRQPKHYTARTRLLRVDSLTGISVRELRCLDLDQSREKCGTVEFFLDKTKTII